MSISKRFQVSKSFAFALAMAVWVNAAALLAPARAEVIATPPASSASASVATTAMSGEAFTQAMAAVTAFQQRAGKLAEVLGQNADLRRFGRNLAQDQKVSQTLTQALAAAQMPVPAATVSDNQESLLQTLHRVDDREFDHMFVDLQIQTQQEALAACQAYAKAGDNEQIRQAAAKLVPLFQQRLSQARSMARVAG